MPDDANSKSGSPAVMALIHRLLKARPGELPLLLWSAAYFFFLLSSYYVLRPLRDELGTAGGVDDLPWLFTASVGTMLVLNPPFSWMVARTSREVFIPVMYGFFALNIFVFFILFRVISGEGLTYLGRTFFVWSAVFSLFVVSVFWGLMADLLTTDQAKRLFGFIAVGGTLGAISGSTITRFFHKILGMDKLFLVSIALLLMSVLCMRALLRLARGGPLPNPMSSKVSGGAVGGSAWSGIGRVFVSPYLLGICLFILIYTITNTYLYIAKIQISGTIAESTDRIAFFASIDLVANVLAVVVQIFLTSRILTRMGIGFTLIILPAFSIVGFVVLAWATRDIAAAGAAPMAALVVTGFESVRRASDYALARPAREALYTVLGREEKYKSKSFIDTFVYRGGDQIGVWSHAMMTGWLGFSLAAIAWVAVPLAGLWLVTGLFLGRAQVRLSQSKDDHPTDHESATEV